MTGSVKEINSAIGRQLCDRIGVDRYELWFSHERSICVTDGHVLVGAADDFSLACIRQQFSEDLVQVSRSVFGPQVRIEFAAFPPTPSTNDQKSLFSEKELAGTGTRQVRKAPRRICRGQKSEPRDEKIPEGKPRSIDEQACLGSFEFGDRNALLRTAVEQSLQDPGKYNPLVIHGGVGCGKTHLLRAMVNHARRSRRLNRCIYMTAEQFTSAFVDALNGRNLTSFRHKYREVDLLAVDDLQFFGGKRATLIEFQNTIETLLRTGKQMIISSDRPMIEMNFLDEEIRTRLACGLVCPVEYADFDARVRIAKRFARQRDLDLTPSVYRLIADKISRDARLISGAVNRLKALSYVDNAPITVEAALDSLRDLFQSQAPLLSISRIEKIVCEVCGVETDDIRSPKRAKRISTARMLAMWLSRKHTPAALAEIGDYFGGRSHSTVVAAEKKIDRLLQENSEVQLRSQRCGIQMAVGRIESDLRVG